MGSFILERDYGSGIGTWHGSRSRLGLLTELLSTNATPVTTGTCLNYRDEVSTTPLSRHVCTGVEMSNRCSIRALDRQASDADGSADGHLRTSGQRPVRTSASLVHPETARTVHVCTCSGSSACVSTIWAHVGSECHHTRVDQLYLQRETQQKLWVWKLELGSACVCGPCKSALPEGTGTHAR